MKVKNTTAKGVGTKPKSDFKSKTNGKVNKNKPNFKKRVFKQNEDTRFTTLPESDELRSQFEHDFRRQKVRERLKDLSIDYLRGELPLVSDSSSDGSDETDYEDSEVESEPESEASVDVADEPDETVIDASHRLILKSMDWDNVRAVDLYVLFNSQKPDSGIIESVTIYPSEFGLRRLQLEDTKGPFAKLPEEEEAERQERAKEASKRQKRRRSQTEMSAEDGNELEKYEKAVRDYELKKMRYYFAVVVCDRTETAQAIRSCNSMMFFGANGPMIDLEFVADNDEFETEPKDVCTKMPDKYKPPSNFNDLFSKVKVKLTWDQTDPFRVEFMSRDNYDDVDDAEWSKYLATPSDSEEEIASPPVFNDGDDDGQAVATAESNAAKKKTDGVVKAAAKKLTTLEKYRELLKEIEEDERREKERYEMSQMMCKEVDDSDAGSSSDNDCDDDDEVEVDENGRVRMDEAAERWKRKQELRKQKKLRNKAATGAKSFDGDTDAKNSSGEDEPDDGRTARRQELELLMDETTTAAAAETDSIAHGKKSKNFSVAKLVKSHEAAEKLRENRGGNRSKKRKLAAVADKETADTFELDLNDERFADVFHDDFYAINPNDPNFKKTKQMKRLLNEKQKRAKNAATNTTVTK